MMDGLALLVLCALTTGLIFDRQGIHGYSHCGRLSIERNLEAKMLKGDLCGNGMSRS